MKEKLKFQLIRLLLIMKVVETLQDEQKKKNTQIDKHLHDKKTVMVLLEHNKSHLKSLSSSFEDAEQNILKLENVTQEKKIEYAVLKENISYWQKKCDYARTSLDSANKAHDTNKRIIQELKKELLHVNNKLLELKEASQSIVELSNSQVSCNI